MWNTNIALTIQPKWTLIITRHTIQLDSVYMVLKFINGFTIFVHCPVVHPIELNCQLCKKYRHFSLEPLILLCLLHLLCCDLMRFLFWWTIRMSFNLVLKSQIALYFIVTFQFYSFCKTKWIGLQFIFFG